MEMADPPRLLKALLLQEVDRLNVAYHNPEGQFYH